MDLHARVSIQADGRAAEFLRTSTLLYIKEGDVNRKSNVFKQ